MSDPIWEVYATVGDENDLSEVYLILTDILKANAIRIGDRSLPIEVINSKQVRARSISGSNEWAMCVGGDLQAELDDCDINAVAAVVRKDG